MSNTETLLAAATTLLGKFTKVEIEAYRQVLSGHYDADDIQMIEDAVYWEGARANANLIAAAPDLYEALLEARPYVPQHHGPIYAKITSAIAKVEGAE